ncbi:type II secretion system protein GspD [bacterium SCN 62-11]|nr:MAG: type II secretion system protein GspD [bacterium SCN 62-11]
MKLKTCLLVSGLVSTLAWAQPPQTPPQAPSGPLIKQDAQRALRRGPISMNYENLDIRVLARIVSELTGRTVVLDEGVSGKVTLLASSQLTSEELWQVFQGVLNKSGFALRQSHGIYQVMPIADVRRDSRQSSMAVVLREGDATQVLTAIRPYISDPNGAQVYAAGKALVLIDTPEVLRQVGALVRSLDRATPRISMETIFLQYAEAEKMAPVLQTVMQRNLVLPGASQPLVTAFPPTNALLVQATPIQMKEIRETVAALDVARSAPLTVEKPRYFVYKLQQGKAEDVAKIVQELLAERKRAQDEEENRRGRQAAGSSTGNANTTASGTANPAVPGAPGGLATVPIPTPVTGATPGSPAQLVYVGARVGADPELNAVLVYISPSEYPSIRSLLASLDRKRKQILVHAVVAEVSLTDLLNTGSKLQLFDSSGPVASFNGGVSEEGLLSFLTSGQFLVGASGGSSRTINVSGRDVQVPSLFGFLTGERTNTNFELISSPRLVATDHKKAEMKVGNVVPFATGARFSQTGQPLVTYDYKDVGIKLEFTPHISQGQTIRLELEQEVQEVTEFLNQNLGGFGYVIPLISNRRVKTDVNLRDGETLLIGGLISRRTTETIHKVPILGDIPLIQNLFRELRNEQKKTSLFIALTPYVVNGQEDINRIDEAYAQFLSKEPLPSQAQWEPRNTELGPQAISDPYAATPQAPKPFLLMEPLKMVVPTSTDRLRQGRLVVKNQDSKLEAEFEMHMLVTKPDKTVDEMILPKARLAPGEVREMLLDPYPFPERAGDYRFDVEAFVNGRMVGKTTAPTVIHNP